MRQKLAVALAVAILALSGARETCKHFVELKSSVGHWSGVWNTMLVYAGAYADVLKDEPAQALLASAASPRGDAAPATARGRRAKTRQAARAARREAAEELTADLAANELTIELKERAVEELADGYMPPPLAPHAPAGEVSQPRPRVGANAAEIADALAGEFNSAFDAAALKGLAAGREAEALRAGSLAELWRRGVAGVAVRKTARGGREGAAQPFKSRFVLKAPDAPRVRAETRRAAEATTREWIVVEADTSVGGGGPDAHSGEGEFRATEGEFFYAPPPSGSGVLNCETQPRR